MFDPDSVVAEEIRKEAGYGGARVLIGGDLAKARCKTQIDIGFGDAVTPAPVDATYPVLLADLPAVTVEGQRINQYMFRLCSSTKMGLC
ncbi:MAG: nucleotidyl transferase AbiEii/AbiGii toxin family protein [Azoarcus sp.]|nr:nucleotidyl transferase AbiEii/AbiGii toxin family protein [Azoarcus sp.]